MKKSISYLFILVLFIIFNSNYSKAAPATVTIKITVVGDYMAKYFPAFYIDKCGGRGDDCRIIVLKIEIESVKIMVGPAGGTSLEIKLGEIKHENQVLDFPAESGIVYPSNSNYVFPPNTKAKIIDSDDINFINLEWDISDQATDANGKFYKYFPF